jgi:hypothetical protein
MKKRMFNKWAISLSLMACIVLVVSSFNQSPTFGIDETTYENKGDAFEYRAIGNSAFKGGEKLNFRVHYGFLNAAKIKVVIDNDLVDVKNRKAYHVIAEGKTISAFDWMYKVRDKFESYVDSQSLAPLKYKKAVRENKYVDTDFVIYQHHKDRLVGVKGKLKMKAYTQDIASALFYARNIDFSEAKVGDIYPIDIYLDNKIYNLAFKYAGKETIKSDVGKVKCIKLIPKLVVDRVFKGEEDMTVWISDDKNKIPIRVKSEIKVGSLKVDLTSYSNLRNPFTAKVKK